MGDKIQATATGQVVQAIGSHAKAENINFVQLWSQDGDIDAAQLASELAALRVALKSEAKTAEEDVQVGSVANAEVAARSGDGAKALEILSGVGRWALDVATKIGVPVATEALKRATGG